MSDPSRPPTPLPSRRDLLKAGAAAGLGLSLARPNELLARPLVETTVPLATPPMDEVRIGFVGVGGMGRVHVRNLLAIEGARITAICDIDTTNLRRAQDLVEAAGFPRPPGYSNGPRDFERMCQRQDIDLVFPADTRSGMSGSASATST
jgi:hypothetical protein